MPFYSPSSIKPHGNVTSVILCVLGTQANLWTEYIPTSEQVEYMVLPRMAALAEVQWTQLEKKDYTNFTTRLAGLIGLYRRDGLNYREPFRQQADSTATEKK